MNAKTGQFVDTNIVIYAYDIHAGVKHNQAKALMENLWHTEAGRLSIQVLQEFYVNVTRKIAEPLDIPTATQVISDLSQWKIHSPNAQDVLHAIRIQQQYQISFWDALIVCSAASLNCTVLWSEDLNPGQRYEGMLVQNPFDKTTPLPVD